MCRLLIIFSAIVFVAGCTPMPPNVGSKPNIDRLDVKTRSIAARRLPDEDIASLARLKNLEILDFTIGWGSYGAKITDRGLAELAKLDLPTLDSLSLDECDKITDAGLEHVAKLKNLSWLGLAVCPGITDAGLPALTTAENLTELDLRGCPNITDEGIQQLAAKRNWQSIDFAGCPKITAAGVAKLQAALPKARIVKDDKGYVMKHLNQWTK